MLRKTGLLSALAVAALTAAPATASEEHYVLIMGTGFFPDFVHPNVGDTIRFRNENEWPMKVKASDNSWSTGILHPMDEEIIVVTAGMESTFQTELAEATATIAMDVPELANDTGIVDYLNDAPVYLGADGQPVDNGMNSN